MKIYQYDDYEIKEYSVDHTLNNNFEFALQFVYLVEKGIVISNHENGGSANKGISQTAYTTFFNKNYLKLPKKRVEHFTDEEFYDIARSIYFDDYWVPSMAEYMPSPFYLVHFDTEVNFGSSSANEFIYSITNRYSKVEVIKYLESLDNDELFKITIEYINRRYHSNNRSSGQKKRDTLLKKTVEYLIQEKCHYRARKKLNKILNIDYTGYTNSIKDYLEKKN